ncbi:MAG: AbrB/MazE/SpoVT family DNA-binding domain-containing protein [Armatimonadetes bacterium]|nr:AbrB/MazE/SpoVT family DNA-binding domain-containing protein [Armatimonadota bacterium]
MSCRINSLAVRIPQIVARELGLSEGQMVDLTVDGDALTLRPRSRKAVSLQALLAEVSDENIHGETDWGPPVGREEW